MLSFNSFLIEQIIFKNNFHLLDKIKNQFNFIARLIHNNNIYFIILMFKIILADFDRIYQPLCLKVKIYGGNDHLHKFHLKDFHVKKKRKSLIPFFTTV